MVALWDNRLLPVTEAIGFFNASLQEVSDGLSSWRAEHSVAPHLTPLNGGLADNVSRLEPLTLRAMPRELLVTTAAPGWTAIFDCGAIVKSVRETTWVMSHRLACRGVLVCLSPDADPDSESFASWGARQLYIHQGNTDKMEPPMRFISVTQDGRRWMFHEAGEIQPFEHPELYKKRSVRARFTPEVLEEYCQAIGLDPWSGDFYPGPSLLLERNIPVGNETFSIEEAQDGRNLYPLRRLGGQK